MKRLFLTLAAVSMMCASGGILNNASAQHRPPQQQTPPNRGGDRDHNRGGSNNHDRDNNRGNDRGHDKGHNAPPSKTPNKPQGYHTPPPSHTPNRPHNHHTPPPPSRPTPPPSRPAPHHHSRDHYRDRGPAGVRVAHSLRAAEDRGTGLYGYLGDFGHWAIAPRYRYAKSFDTEVGLAVVQLTNGAWGAINVIGQTAIKFNFRSSLDVESAIRSIKKGRYQGIDLWNVYDPATELWGYLDYRGEWYITPQFLSARDLSDRGIAIVQFKHGGWGAIDRNGRIVIEPNFNYWIDVDSALRRLGLN